MTDKKIPPSKKVTVEPKHADSLNMLKNFGLTENEARIYIYLLERGTEVGGSKIAFGTDIHRQYVYITIARLLESGLVEAIEHGKQKKYKAVAPSQIEKLARRRVSEAEDIVRKLNTFSTIGHEQDFEVVQGERAIQKFEIARVRSANPETMQYFIGGGSEHFVRIMGETYEEYASMVSNNKIGSQYIGCKDEQDLGRFFDNAQKKFEFRMMENLPKSLVNVMIMNDTLSFYTYANPPILYVVKSKVVSESYKKFFDMLWAMAQKP